MFGASFGNTGAFGSTTSPFGANKPAGGLTFGSTPTPAFGATGATTGFGSGATGGSSLFGAPKPAFGAAPAPAFGASAAPAFGAAPAAAPAFGAAPAASPFGATSSAFGAAKPAFGAAPAASPFGAPAASGGGLFGSPAPAPAAGGLFGGASASPFGAPKPAAFGTTGAFGAAAAPAASPFGATSGVSTFGAPAPAPAGGGLFGAPAAAPGGFGGFGATAGAQTGTSSYAPTEVQDGTTKSRMISISAAEQYKQKSFEELRVEDYMKGNKGGATSGAFGAAATPSPFGAPAPAAGAPSFGFGATAPAPAAGAFGFGSPAPAPATGGLFGAPAAAPAAFGGFGATTPQKTGFSFGATPAPAAAAAPFGAAPAPAFGAAAPGASPFGAAAPAAGGFSFGATPAPAPGTSPFGASAAPAAGGFAFGASAAKPAFGATPAPAAGGFSFGAAAPAPAPAAGGFAFGAAAPAPAAGGFSFGGAAPAPAAGGLFGATAAKPAATFGGFGSPAPAPAFGAFGSPAPAPAAGGFSFGAAPAAPAAGGFSFGTQAPATAAGSLFGAAPAAGSSLFGAAGVAQPQPFGAAPAAGGPLVGSHNQGVFGQALGAAGGLAAKLAAVEARASGLEIRLGDGARPLLSTARGNLEGTGGGGAAGVGGGGAASALPSYRAEAAAAARGVARIYPRGVGGARGAYGGAGPGASPALLRLRSDGLATSGIFSPDTYAGSSAKKLQIKPDAHRRGGAGALVMRPGVAARINFSQVAEEGDGGDGGGGGGVPAAASPPRGSRVAASPEGRPTTPGSPAGSAATPARPTPVRPAPGSASSAGGPGSAPRAADGYPSPSFSSPLLAEKQRAPAPASRPPPPERAGGAGGGEEEEEEPPCPVLTRPGYYTEPPLAELARLPAAALAALPAFLVGRRGAGAIKWEGGGLDVRGLDLDRLVQIEDRAAAVYEGMEEVKPPVGQGLNRPALITLEGVLPPEGADPAKFAAKVEKRTRKMGAEFVDYDPARGIWQFRTPHFSRYGLADSDSEEDSEGEAATGPEAAAAAAAAAPLGQAKKLQVRPRPGAAAAAAAAAASPLPARLGLNARGVEDMRLAMMMGGQGDERGYASPFQPKLFGGESLTPQQPVQPQPPRSPWGNASTMTPVVEQHMEIVPAGLPAPRDAEPPQLPTTLPKRKTKPFYPVAESATAQLLQEAAEELQSSLGHAGPKKRYPKAQLDYAVFMGRSFRVGWGPNGEIVHPGKLALALGRGGGASGGGGGGMPDHPGAREGGHRLVVEKVAANSLPSRVAEGRALRAHFEPLMALHVAAATPAPPPPGATVELAPGVRSAVAARFRLPEAVPFAEAPTTATVAGYRRWVACVHSFAQAFAAGEAGPPPGGAGAAADRAAQAADQAVGQAWALTNALFGQERTDFDGATPGLLLPVLCPAGSAAPGPLRRRAAIAAWLRDAVAPLAAAEEAREGEAAAARGEACYDRIYRLLAAGRPGAAAAAAQAAGCHRLGAILAQAADPVVRDLVLEQVEQWQETGAIDHVSPGLLRCYAAVSGQFGALYRPTHGALAAAGRALDWRRHLGMYLWYPAGLGEGVGQALEEYDEAVAAGEAPAPLAWYAQNAAAAGAGGGGAAAAEPACILHRLLRLYAAPQRSYALSRAVDPRGTTPDPLDYRNAWHFLTILQKLRLFPDEGPDGAAAEDALLGQVTDAIVFQLLGAGLWEWACYALAHLPDDARRTLLVRNLLDRHAHGASEPPEEYEARCAFAAGDLKLPRAWCAEARARFLQAHAPRAPRTAAACWLQAGAPGAAHAALRRAVLPPAALAARARATAAAGGGGGGPAPALLDAQLAGWLATLETAHRAGGEAAVPGWVAPGGGALFLAHHRLGLARAALQRRMAVEGLSPGAAAAARKLAADAQALVEALAAWAPPPAPPAARGAAEAVEEGPGAAAAAAACRAELARDALALQLALGRTLRAEADAPERAAPLGLEEEEEGGEGGGLGAGLGPAFGACGAPTDMRLRELGRAQEEFMAGAVARYVAAAAGGVY